MPSKFDFISPDILLREVDESQVPNEVTDDGALIIGQSIAGPAMKPVKIKNLNELYEVFGRPQSGKSNATDIWRDGNTKLPTYGLYAAQAWLASETSPVTFVRLLGEDQASSKQGGSYVKAGWTLDHAASTTIASNKLAYGLFVAPSASTGAANGTLAAIIYTSGAALALSGTIAGTTSTTTASAGVMINSDSTSGQPNTFKLEVHTGPATSESFTFHLNDNIQDGFIRNVLNCNPQKLTSTNQAATEKYFLGESHETNVKEIVTDTSSSAGKQVGVLLPLASGSAYWADQRREATAAKAGWFINRNPNPTSGYASYDLLNADKLFRLISLHDGEWFQRNYAAVIQDLKLGTVTSPDSTFTVGIQNLESGLIEETFTGCNLNENSEDFIGRRIGTQFQTWDQTNDKYILKGDYPNVSDYVYVEMSDAWKAGLSDTFALPFGFYGPARPVGFTLKRESTGPQLHGDGTNAGVKSTATITYTAGMQNGDKLTITHPALGDFVVNFVNDAGGSTETAFTSQTANVNQQSDATNSTLTATRVIVLLNKIPGYSAVTGGAGVVTFTADETGPYWTVTYGTEVDGSSVQALPTPTAGTDTDDTVHAFVDDSKSSSLAIGHTAANAFINTHLSNVTSSYKFPTFRLTETGTKNGGNYRKEDYFGVRHARDNDANTSAIFEGKDYKDIVRALPASLDIFASNGTSTETAFVFSLDEIIEDTSGKYYYSSGSHAAQTAVTSNSGSKNLLETQKVKQFRAPFFGGFDGVDITLVDPFSSAIALSGKNETSSYAYYSVNKVIDLVSDSEIVQYDVVSIPGLTNTALQRELIENTGDRGDALAIVDFDGGYLAAHENSGTQVLPTVSGVISDANTADYNSSYAATYYPPVRLGGLDSGLVVPSSVAGIGVLAQSDAASGAPWFAPAGFNRGGIRRLGGNNGPRVAQATENLNKADRDDLYQVNINPIANFPGEGTVVFGQKTLQQTPSALDRINVRRLMIYLKSRVGAVARTVLFDQNVRATWNRFKASAEPILADAKSRFGVSEYKLVLDETTTTPDYQDRNIMYAKVFIKPAKAIEFIAIDFSITRSGIEF